MLLLTISWELYETSGSDQFKKDTLIYTWNDQYSLRLGMVKGNGGGGGGSGAADFENKNESKYNYIIFWQKSIKCNLSNILHFDTLKVE